MTIPYTLGSKTKPIYIEFLIIRSTAVGLTVDIIDPHNQNLGDAADELAGLASYAEKHDAKFGRVESIIVENDTDIRRLNLQDEAIQKLAMEVRTSADVQSLFDRKAVSNPTG